MGDINRLTPSGAQTRARWETLGSTTPPGRDPDVRTALETQNYDYVREYFISEDRKDRRTFFGLLLSDAPADTHHTSWPCWD